MREEKDVFDELADDADEHSPTAAGREERGAIALISDGAKWESSFTTDREERGAYAIFSSVSTTGNEERCAIINPENTVRLSYTIGHGEIGVIRILSNVAQGRKSFTTGRGERGACA